MEINIRNLNVNISSDLMLSSKDDITIKTGDVICLIGNNASGKSTTLNTIAGIYDDVDKSTITVNGKSISGWREMKGKMNYFRQNIMEKYNIIKLE